MRIGRHLLLGLAAMLTVAGLGVVAAQPASAASLVQVTSFGNNPGGMEMYVYVPDVRPASPAIVVAMHGCGGSGPGFYAGSEFASLADRYGFIVIYPSAQQQAGFGKCFDTWSAASKVRGGGSDPVSIVSMVTYAEQRYGGDPGRVYATGSSSGGMMTDEMLALYPDVFKAGAAFMGVPFDCFSGAADYPPGSSKCTGGGMDRTPQDWGNRVRAAYPGYTGPRPPIQLWHGTADTLVPYSLLQEDIEQWTNVFGLSQTPTATDTPQPGWNRRRYADAAGRVDVEAYSIQGAGHSLPSAGMAAYAIAFFGLNGSTTPPTSPTGTPPTSPPTTPPTTGGCRVAATVNAWSTGLTESITITNTSTAPINGWKLTFTLPAGQTITSGWNATYAPASGAVTATNASYNAAVAPGASVGIGFQAGHTGNTAAPASFALNGAACTTS
ncbi:PHB depolymerase family esterase [Actinoplanes sp. N902-109]|uniref:extracellular catalytic domain type 1 short-chain-length polyhydroxyalkanoate depolymerase n=1 Tax=Actinoplanes sp. (strain N902-109) TaxID=649831 RepID=UPI0003293853|nr:PHB depolymerase family esterase [Actinoplanes sp. N902-109]AGL16691.1 PHB depolymerase family esterase [Actinoplanes sp. N902-109]